MILIFHRIFTLLVGHFLPVTGPDLIVLRLDNPSNFQHLVLSAPESPVLDVGFLVRWVAFIVELLHITLRIVIMGVRAQDKIAVLVSKRWSIGRSPLYNQSAHRLSTARSLAAEMEFVEVSWDVGGTRHDMC